MNGVVYRLVRIVVLVVALVWVIGVTVDVVPAEEPADLEHDCAVDPARAVCGPQEWTDEHGCTHWAQDPDPTCEPEHVEMPTPVHEWPALPVPVLAAPRYTG